MKTKIAFLSLLLTVIYGAWSPALAVKMTIKNKTLLPLLKVEVPHYTSKGLHGTFKIEIRRGKGRVAYIVGKQYTSYTVIVPKEQKTYPPVIMRKNVSCPTLDPQKKRQTIVISSEVSLKPGSLIKFKCEVHP